MILLLCKRLLTYSKMCEFVCLISLCNYILSEVEIDRKNSFAQGLAFRKKLTLF